MSAIQKQRKSRLMGFLAGGILRIFRRGKLPVKPEDLARLDFGASAQKMGVRFTEKLREGFRRRWLRIGKSR